MFVQPYFSPFHNMNIGLMVISERSEADEGQEEEA